MLAKELKDKLINSLWAKFSEREATSIAKILLEDKFGVKENLNTEIEISDNEFMLIQKQLLEGIPIQYVTGKSFFYNYFFNVNPTVLIPRPETEELVFWMLSENKNEALKILDIGTGSGCISLTLGKERPNWQILALDKSVKAIATAYKNALNLDVLADFIQLDFLDNSKWASLPQVDLLVSNPPYIASKDPIDAHVLNFEPRMALYADGTDPLIFYKKLAEFMVFKKIAVGYFELNSLFYEEIQDIFIDKGFQCTLKKDMQGKFRMLKCIK